jgi:hypothetical protein
MANLIIDFKYEDERNYSLLSYRHHNTSRETRYMLPTRPPSKGDKLSSSWKMPYCKKTADELLLGLLYDPQDLCFPDFEVLNDGETCQLNSQEALADVRLYRELMDINGKRLHFRWRIWKLTGLGREIGS